MKHFIIDIIISAATSLFIFAILFFLLVFPHLREAKMEASKDYVHWTNIELMSWSNLMGITQVVVRAGVREDGVVVWKEVLMNGRTEPAMFFAEKYTPEME